MPEAVTDLLGSLSPEVKAALLGGISGGVVGGLLGVLGALLGVAWERYLARRAKVRCRVIRVQPTSSATIKDDNEYDVQVGYNFRIGFFNQKDIDSGLTDLRGAVIGPDGRDFVTLGESVKGDRTINLPAGKWTFYYLDSDQQVGEDRIEDTAKCNRVQVRATWPNGRRYKSARMKFDFDIVGSFRAVSPVSRNDRTNQE